MASRAVEAHGLGDLVRTFKKMPDEVVEEFVDELAEAANPVKLAAQAKAPTSMRNMVHTREWGAMRVGVSRRDVTVWVAPQLRGRGKLRKTSQKQKDTFVKNMQTRAMDPALEENRGQIEDRIEGMLDRIADHHGF